MLVFGHRGSRGTLPENTIPAFLSAIEAGVDGLELDLLATKDGAIVIHHNFFLNPVLCKRFDGEPVDEKQLVLDTTLADLKKLDCGGDMLPGTQVPTLEELFTAILNSPSPYAKTVILNLEIKREFPFPECSMEPFAFAKKLVSLVSTFGFENRVYYSSFDIDSLIAVRVIDPDAKLGYLFEKEPLDIPKGMQIFSPHYSILTPELFAKLKKLGQVILWTVNEPELWEKFSEMGVDGLITDCPKALLDFLKK
jgi:glycerophosphoryl diester phosphodiesterase